MHDRSPRPRGGRPSSARGLRDVAARRAARGSWLDETLSTSGTRRTSNPSRSSRSRSPARPRPKRKPSPAATTSAPIAAQDATPRTPRRRARRAPRRSGARATSSMPGSSSSSSRRSSVAEQLRRCCPKNVTRVRVERHDRRPQARRARRVDHAPVAAVDAVEGADRDRAPRGGELLGRRDDVHAARASPRARARRLGEQQRRLERLGRRRRPRRRTARPPFAAACAVAAERIGDRTHVRPGADAQVERHRRRPCTRRRRARTRSSGAAASPPRRRAAPARYARSPSIFTADAAGIGSSISPRRRREPLLELVPRPAARATRRSHLPDRRSTCARGRSTSVR